MARPATGQIIERTAKDGRVYRSLRYRCKDGSRQRESLGVVSQAEADETLRHRMADIERGWTPERTPSKPVERAMPTFHEFAAEWWTLREHDWRERTKTDYRWRLEQHLLPRFADDPLNAIDFAAVENYIAEKRREGFSPRTVNMTVTLMATILDLAVERDLIARNPAKGRNRRVREHAPKRSYIDSAAGIAALLDAAGKQKGYRIPRRAILTVFCFAGLRVSELCALRWRDVDLADGWLSVGESKTDAGVRRVRLRGIVRDELSAIRPADADPDALVFGTKRDKPLSATNIGSRILEPAAKAASESLTAQGLPPLPTLSPHSLRRTFASVLVALGEDVGVVMDEMGHTDAAFTLRVYRQTMRRDESERQALRDLVEGVWANDWANDHANAPEMASESQI